MMNVTMSVSTHDSRYSVFGIGNPLLDFIVHADYSFLERVGARAGTMNLIESDLSNRLLGEVGTSCHVPGGSCANTIRGIAWLRQLGTDHQPVYCGAVGGDEVGARYLQEMRRHGVRASVSVKTASTGVSVVVVTPDRERTMFTYLGASREFCVDDVDFERLRSSRYIHFTGYMWDTENQREAVQQSATFAADHGVRVSFDLADPLAVERYRDGFLKWIPGRVDILFANRDELALLTREDGDDATILRRARGLAPVVVMKVGPRGCIVGEGDGHEYVPGNKVAAVDTTGAGDAFAAGLLYGVCRGLSVTAAAGIGCRVGGQMVTVEGCDFRKLSLSGMTA